ncbi:TIGR02678 family protein [Salinisphaera sp. RV14]|uniref:TIGR02678 family protein n=1 Tax=unclassified Salinisphaera TaxID=2649847 RepID=UPI003F87B4E9
MAEAAVIDARTREIDEQRQRALRALLARPLMPADDRVFGLVRAHADYLRTWFARECGWVLRVERGHARLAKRAADVNDASRGAREFNRNRYILLCLALAVLEREDVQITLARLGERLMVEALDSQLAASGFVFALDRQTERRDLVAVCRLLLALGIISRVAGDEQAYINQSGDALYDIHRPLLAGVLAGDRGPSAVADAGTLEARLAALAADNLAEGEDARRTALRHRLSRRLLDDPLLYLDELDTDEREYFLNQRGPMGRRLAEATGLAAEHRAEGTALVDARGELTDVALPQQGTDAHATLLLAEFLAARLRAGQSGPVPEAEVLAFMREAAREHRKYWRKAAQESGAERTLAAAALERLEALRLIRRADQTIEPLPAICRFRLGEARVTKQSDLLSDL